jgi:hypothetical protein
MMSTEHACCIAEGSEGKEEPGDLTEKEKEQKEQKGKGVVTYFELDMSGMIQIMIPILNILPISHILPAQ